MSMKSRALALAGPAILTFSIFQPKIAHCQSAEKTQDTAVIDWFADLKPVSPAADRKSTANKYASEEPSAGKASAFLNFSTHSGTITVELPGVSGVKRIELRSIIPSQSPKPSILLTIFETTRNETFSGKTSATVTGDQFSEVSKAIENGHASIMVITNAGALSGTIKMHKSYHQPQ